MTEPGKRPNNRIAAMLISLIVLECVAQPLQRIVATVHEASHWAAVVGTGGRVIEAHQSGITGHVSFEGGWTLLILFAGYSVPVAIFALATAGLRANPWLFPVSVGLSAAALMDVLTDSIFSSPQSDLQQLYALTGIPTPVWCACFLGLGVASYFAGAATARLTSSHPAESIR